MMVNLSQPIGFPTAALAALDIVDDVDSKVSKKQPKHSYQSKAPESPSLSKTTSKVAPDDDDEGAPNDLGSVSSLRLLTTEYDSSDSFCLVPSTSESSSSKNRLKRENAALKAQLHSMQQQIVSIQKQMDARARQDQQMKDRLMIARKEVRSANKDLADC